MKRQNYSAEESIRRASAILCATPRSGPLLAVVGVSRNEAALVVAELLCSSLRENGERVLLLDLQDRSIVQEALSQARAFSGRTVLRCPALDASPVGFEIARRVDGILLVIDADGQRADSLESSVQALRRSGGVVLGGITILNSKRKIATKRSRCERKASVEQAPVPEVV
jgi:hypothetical protein